MIRVELVKMLRRPRTWATIAALNALPTVIAILLAATDLGPAPGKGPPFLSAVLSDGTLFPLAALGIVLPLFLPVAVAVVGGDAIAGEAEMGTLRYLLIRPVRRGHGGGGRVAFGNGAGDFGMQPGGERQVRHFLVVLVPEPPRQPVHQAHGARRELVACGLRDKDIQFPVKAHESDVVSIT